MGWTEPTGQKVSESALEKKPHGGEAGEEAEKAWVESEKAARADGEEKTGDSPEV